jgi:hypothetical protein
MPTEAGAAQGSIFEPVEDANMHLIWPRPFNPDSYFGYEGQSAFG